eukprot:2756981-Prymnesium_polylepis.2
MAAGVPSGHCQTERRRARQRASREEMGSNRRWTHNVTAWAIERRCCRGRAQAPRRAAARHMHVASEGATAAQWRTGTKWFKGAPQPRALRSGLLLGRRPSNNTGGTGIGKVQILRAWA